MIQSLYFIKKKLYQYVTGIFIIFKRLILRISAKGRKPLQKLDFLETFQSYGTYYIAYFLTFALLQEILKQCRYVRFLKLIISIF